MSQEVTPPSIPEELSYEQFSVLVEADIRGRASQPGSDWLRLPENLTSWLRELGFVRRSVEASMNFMANEKREHSANPINFDGDQKKANEAGWAEVVAEIEGRKTRAMKFLSYVNARIKEAAYLIEQNNVARYNEVDMLMQLHKVENLLIDGEAERALGLLSNLIDDFEEQGKVV